MPCALRRSTTRFLSCVALFIGSCAGTNAGESAYFHIYDQSPRLNAGSIQALAQDDAGFIWVGTLRGLYRFDGRNYLAWGHDKLDEQVDKLIHGPGDELLAGTQRGAAWRRVADGLEPLVGPDGTPIANLVAFDFDKQGYLWAVLGRELWRRERSQHWQRIEHGIPPQETLRSVRAIGNSMVVLTREAAWRLRGAEAAEKVLDQPDLRRIAGTDAVLWLATRKRLWRADQAGTREVLVPEQDFLDLRMRGTTLWLSDAHPAVVAFDADGSQHRIEQVPTSGPLFVDRENSLWVGGFVLAQFPEPDTRVWIVAGGPYKSREADGALWVSAWGYNLTRIDMRTGAAIALPRPIDGEVCALGAYGIWASDDHHLLAWRNGRFEVVADLPQPAGMNSCVADRRGNLWFATEKNLLRIAPGATQPQSIELGNDESAALLWLDEDDRLHFANKAHVCRLRVAADNVATLEQCAAEGNGRTWLSHAHIDAQHDWLVAYEGVFEFDGRGITFLPGNHRVEGGVIHYLAPATNGDWWASGPSALLRLRPCSGCAEGWTVTETPGAWQGLPDNVGNQAIETAGGDVWISSTENGVFRLPQAVRKLAPPTPTIVPVRAEIDAVARAPASAIELTPEDHRLELEFAALSFRDRSLLRFRSRINAGEWSAPSHDPRLQFAALEPGAYRVEMSASLDGTHWADPPATIDFSVLPPWYRTWWARSLFALAALALLTSFYRLRVAALLHVQTERTRIAMDLHDEMGAGLSSIGMLAGAAARTPTDGSEQQRIVEEIAQVAKLLGSGLRSLVWSLRGDNTGLAGLGAQIADNARRMFPGDEPRLTLRLPAHAPEAALAVEVRRHVLLFALEALHNVARHAGARKVEVHLEAIDPQGLRLRIEDDGKGFDTAQESAGTGLESMRRRAHAIGAHLDIASHPGAGTMLTLTCPDPGKTA